MIFVVVWWGVSHWRCSARTAHKTDFMQARRERETEWNGFTTVIAALLCLGWFSYLVLVFRPRRPFFQSRTVCPETTTTVLKPKIRKASLSIFIFSILFEYSNSTPPFFILIPPPYSKGVAGATDDSNIQKCQPSPASKASSPTSYPKIPTHNLYLGKASFQGSCIWATKLALGIFPSQLSPLWLFNHWYHFQN